MDQVQQQTLYVLTEGAYLRLDGQTVLVEIDGQTALRVPFHLIESIACFGRIMVSPQLLGTAAEKLISVSFLSANGRLLARVDAPGSGNVQLRRAQFRKADDPLFSLELSRTIVAGKIQNARQNLLRSSRDCSDTVGRQTLKDAAEALWHNIESLSNATTLNEVRGIEGDAARLYFEHFALMTPGAPEPLRFVKRSRQPALDPINSLLSLFYSIVTNDCASALASVGLDPSVGFFHEDRPGRPSLALDLVEEFRATAVDRFVITLINRKQISLADFVTRPGGAVELGDSARRKIIAEFQERKQEKRRHPYLDEDAPLGRFPFLQARLLARHIRGELNHYVPVLFK